jgi:hypothetical protein
MIDHIKRIVADFMAGFSPTKYGTVSSYNPTDYTVKVILQPEGIETGFVPLAAAWVGNNLGAVFGPSVGDVVRLDFIDGSAQATVVGGRFFSVNARPPVVQSGQAAIVDSHGSYVRLNNDGTITMGAPTGITSTTPLLKQIGNFEVDGDTLITGNTVVSKSITATLDISDQGGAHGSLKGLRDAHNGHNHGNVQNGTGISAGPSITV